MVTANAAEALEYRLSTNSYSTGGKRSMPTAFDIGAVILFVGDLDRSKNFYQDKLGLSVQFEDEASAGFAMDGAHFIVLEVGRAKEQLQGETTSTPASGATAFLTTFTDDVDGLHTQLSQQGVTFFQTPTDQPWGMRTAYFKDPDGHVWEIAQPLEH